MSERDCCKVQTGWHSSDREAWHGIPYTHRHRFDTSVTLVCIDVTAAVLPLQVPRGAARQAGRHAGPHHAAAELLHEAERSPCPGPLRAPADGAIRRRHRHPGMCCNAPPPRSPGGQLSAGLCQHLVLIDFFCCREHLKWHKPPAPPLRELTLLKFHSLTPNSRMTALWGSSLELVEIWLRGGEGYVEKTGPMRISSKCVFKNDLFESLFGFA